MATVDNLKWLPFLTTFTFSLPTLVVEHTFYTSPVRQTVQTSRVEYPLLPTATPWHSTRPVYLSRTPAQSLPLTPPSYPPCSLQLHRLPTSRPSGPGRRATFGRSRRAQRTSCPWNTSPSAVCRLGGGGLPLRFVPEVARSLTAHLSRHTPCDAFPLSLISSQ